MNGSISNPGGGFDFSDVTADPVSGAVGGSRTLDIFNSGANALGGILGSIATISGNVRAIRNREGGNADDLSTVNDRATGAYPTRYEQPTVAIPAWGIGLALVGVVIAVVLLARNA